VDELLAPDHRAWEDDLHREEAEVRAVRAE